MSEYKRFFNTLVTPDGDTIYEILNLTNNLTSKREILNLTTNLTSKYEIKIAPIKVIEKPIEKPKIISELDKIHQYYNKPDGTKYLIHNILFTIDTRFVSSRKELMMCLNNTASKIRFSIIRNRKRNYRVLLNDNIIERIIPRCDDKTYYGYFSYSTIKRHESLDLFPIEMTPSLEDNIEYIVRKTLLHNMKLTDYPFKQETVDIMLKILFSCVNKTMRLTFAMNNFISICFKLLQNKHVNPQQIIDFMSSHHELASVDISEYIFKNPRFNLLSFVKKTNINIREITYILESPALTDEIFSYVKASENYKYVNTYNVNGIYETLSLNVLLENFKYLNPVLMYKYKKHDVKDRQPVYYVWYEFPEYRDEFIKTLNTLNIRKHFHCYDYDYVSYLVTHVKLTKETLIKLVDISLRSQINLIYKNPTLTVDITHMMYQIKIIPDTWFLTKYIPIKDICKLLYYYKDVTKLTHIYRRVDLPFNVLVYLTNGKLSRKACKNIYITKQLIIEHNIKPSYSSLRKNMFHLDPRYVKHPSCSIEI